MKERWLEVEKEKKPEGAPEEKKETKKGEKGAKGPPKPQLVKRKVCDQSPDRIRTVSFRTSSTQVERQMCSVHTLQPEKMP